MKGNTGNFTRNLQPPQTISKAKKLHSLKYSAARGGDSLLAPNLIVLERLLSDFAPHEKDSKSIFVNDPLVPPELRDEFRLQVVTPDNVPSEWHASQGYLVLSNIHKLYPDESAKPAEDEDVLQSLFDMQTPPTKLDLGISRLQDFVAQAKTPLLVFNDEAHHVHDEALHYAKAAVVKDEDAREGIAWNRVLDSICKRSGLALQCDLSATLFEETSRQWFRHTLYDYPLQQAIKERIVKQPYLGKITLQYKDGHDEPIDLVDDSASNAFDKNSQLIQAGIAQWKREQRVLDDANINRKALLFIVCNTKGEAAQIAERLEQFPDAESGQCLFAGKVIEIHIGKKELANDKDWQKIRDEIQKVDSNDSPYTAIVSVMMLKEGWDVRNVKVIVPLRPCDSRQLTEQLLGRGLRRMFPPMWTPEGEPRGDNGTDNLYVMRHPSFEKIIKNISDIIEEETDATPPSSPNRVLVRLVEPMEEREKRDLPICTVVGAFETDNDWIDRIGRNNLPPLKNRHQYVTDLKEIEGIIKHESAALAEIPGQDAVHYDVQTTGYSSIDAVISAYAEAVRGELRVTRTYEPAIKGILKAFIERCTFNLKGIPLSMEAAAEADEETRQIVLQNIQRSMVKSDVIKSVAKVVGDAREGKETPDVEIRKQSAAHDLAEFETGPTAWELKNPTKSVHSVCYFDSSDELRLAKLLEEADDVRSWLWNDQTGVGYRIQYSFEGRTPYYYPDFLVQLTDGNVYIIESKGSIRERDRAKSARAERYASLLGDRWHYLFLINDSSIGRQDTAWWQQQGRTAFRDLVKHIDNAATGGGLF